ncbi:carboxymuconolactone decarboxylase family protein [Actinomadura barringtoniae]|uniref:Carboxymuconolactone decarboxylase family protein n=1 Tax=Actinomadura barringtoniae TaxID=1427535 RepID=A0A939PE57_9ACTN|nr:carboxymuconolactone decarboxylase family protein [Actinomadura barringtoniae]MBO2448019.1 carboxymuconolactone decarboxylase family protein [Actinomadura barringtoniae]
MARIPFPDLTALPPEAEEAIAALPAPLNIFTMAAHAPTTTAPIIGLGRALLTTLELDARIRELTILWVARRTGADYEWIQHEPFARRVGAGDEQIRAVRDLDLDAFAGPDRLALGLADRLLMRQPVTDIDGLLRHFPARQITELVLVVGYYTMLAGLMVTLDIDVDPVGDQLADEATRIVSGR